MYLTINFLMEVKDLEKQDLERINITNFKKLRRSPQIEWISDEHYTIRKRYSSGNLVWVIIDYTSFDNRFIKYLNNLNNDFYDFIKNKTIRFPIETFDNDFEIKIDDDLDESLTYELTLQDLCQILYGFLYDLFSDKIKKIESRMKKISEELKNVSEFKTVNIDKLTNLKDSLEIEITDHKKFEDLLDKLKDNYYDVYDI
jgi:hypothetical protein